MKFFNPFKKIWRFFMTFEDQLLATLNNTSTILTNQAAILTAIQGIPGANTTAITTALAAISAQTTDIDSQITAITAQFQPTPTPTPAPTPVPTPAPTPAP